jgi:hypothetical protein
MVRLGRSRLGRPPARTTGRCTADLDAVALPGGACILFGLQGAIIE